MLVAGWLLVSFSVMRRANIVYATAETRAEAERLLATARRQHLRDRVRVIDVEPYNRRHVVAPRHTCPD